MCVLLVPPQDTDHQEDKMSTTATETVAALHTEAGWGAWVKVTIAATPEAEAAALAFFRRACRYEVGMMDYAVSEVEGFADEIGEDLLEYFSPTCEHGLSALLCAGPGHYPMD